MKRVLCSSTAKSGWWSKYYQEISIEKLADLCGMDVEDIASVDNLPAYDAEHVAWLIAKPEYMDMLDCYESIELVREGGETFLGDVVADRLYNVDDDIKRNLGVSE